MAKKNIEVEVRSLISVEQYKKLLKFFKKNGKFLGKEKQVTHYFSGKHDFRIQKSDTSAKIWLKKGAMHDDSREEIEVALPLGQFENAYKLLEVLGYDTEITWLRVRNIFSWKGVKVMLDNTKGYGFIIEFEKMCDDSRKEKVLSLLRSKMQLLEIDETPKEEFNKKFENYKKNWKKLIKG